VIRLTTITLRHFDAGERAPSTTPIAEMAAISLSAAPLPFSTGRTTLK
jgi:hypothetical protein